MNRTLKLDLFGGLKAHCADGPVVEFRPNFTGNLLAYLALRVGRSHPRDHLADILWPDEPDTESARHKLRQTLRQLRLKLDAIQPGLADLVLVSSPSSVSLNPDSVATDVGSFLRGIADSERSTNPTEWTPVLERALDIYCAELLTGFYSEVFEQEREHLASIYRSSRKRLRSGYESLGELEKASETARRIILDDPLDEESHCDLMRIYAALGRPAEVARQYQALSRALKAELDVAPAETTQPLYQRLVAESRTRLAEKEITTESVASAPISLSPASPTGPAPEPKSTSQRRAGIRRIRWVGAGMVAAILLAILVGLGIRSRIARNQKIGASTREAASDAALAKYTYQPRPGEKWNAQPTAVATDKQGFVYITGFIETRTRDTDYITIKLNPDFSQAWAKTYDGRVREVDRARSLVVDEQGDVYVLGDSFRRNSKFKYHLCELDLVVIKYRGSDGKVLWTRPIDSGFGGKEIGVKIALDNKGSLIVGGTSWAGEQDSDFFFARLSPGDGEVAWQRRFDGPNVKKLDELRDFCLDESGNIYATGFGDTVETTTSVMTRPLTMRIFPKGNPDWRVYFGSGLAGSGSGKRIVWEAQSGRIYIAAELNLGHAATGGMGYEIALLAYSQSGTQVFDTIMDGHSGVDFPNDLAVAPNGSIWVVGRNAGNFAAGTFPADGGKASSPFWVGGKANGEDHAVRVLVDSAGNVLSIGVLENGHISIGGTCSDYAIFKHTADGKQLSYLGYDSGFRRGDSLTDAVFAPDGTLVCVSHTETKPNHYTIHAARFRP